METLSQESSGVGTDDSDGWPILMVVQTTLRLRGGILYPANALRRNTSQRQDRDEPPHSLTEGWEICMKVIFSTPIEPCSRCDGKIHFIFLKGGEIHTSNGEERGSSEGGRKAGQRARGQRGKTRE